MVSSKAFLFDLNGTMIDDMAYHLKVWYKVVHDELGSPLTMGDVKRNMYGKNDDLIFRVFGKDRFSSEELLAISKRKEKYYQELYKPDLALIAGLNDFLQNASDHGILMGIGSAAITDNINFVVDNLNIRPYFNAIVSADDVQQSKPHPETFLKVAQRLNVKPSACVVFEDAPKGVESAQNAGMPCVVLTTMHEAAEFKAYTNILMFVSDYNDPKMQVLFN